MIFRGREHFFDEQYRTWRIVLLGVMSALGILFITVLAHWAERKALVEAEISAQKTLAYQSSNLVSHLNKFSLITAFIARRPDVINMFRMRNDNVIDGDSIASIASGLSGAKDFWFIDKDGDIFSSNSPSMIGVSVKDEAYFEAGFQGRLGRTSTIDDNGVRYYVYASPVFVNKKVAGLVAVRIDLEVIESVWVLLNQPVMATEANGQVLLSNIEAWRLHYFSEIIKKQNISPSIIDDNVYTGVEEPSRISLLLEEYLAIGDDKINTLSQNERSEMKAYIIELSHPLSDKRKVHYLEVSKNVPLLEWRVHVLVDLSPVKKQWLFTIFFGVLILILVVLLVWVIFERQRRAIERVRDQQAFALHLERQVRDRTHELTATNKVLELEIHDRKLAEKALRETQQDLLQAAKLAGIGQMSAALAHEYNQPLAAIRSYADNALQLLALEKNEDVQANLYRISALTERMADLTKTLRSFAHKSDTKIEAVSLASIMDEMIILLSPQAKNQGVELVVQPPDKPVNVLADHLRLSQVIINLVTNAMDAVKNCHSQRVDVSWFENETHAVIAVKDSGEGISDEVKDKIFMPFFTTKGVGVGLGLGLFIAYNMVKEFRGTIEVSQENGIGCVFYITLPLAV